MSHGIWAAASGATAQITMVDVIANNAANAMTPGFRADRALFREHLMEAQDGRMGTQSLRMSKIDGVRPDMEPGAIHHTGRSLDVAINGDGFFAVRSPAGERYTRAGDMKVNSSGQLVTSHGDPYLNSTRIPIQVDPSRGDVSVSQTGAVMVGGEDTGQRLLVVGLPDQTGIEKEGHQYLRVTAGGRPEAIEAELAPGALERSNSPPVKAMSGLVTATRHFDMMDRVIQAFSEIDRRAASDIAGR